MLPVRYREGIISTIDDNSRRQIHDGLLADLTSAREGLVEIVKDTIRKLLAARSALAIATLAGFGPDTPYAKPATAGRR